MKEKVGVAIVEDHQLIIDCIVSALSSLDISNYNFDFIKTYSDKDIYQSFTNSSKLNNVDLVFLDIMFSQPNDINNYVGENIGKFLRKTHPEIKIILCTSISNIVVIKSLIKCINPEGFLLKEDVDSEDIKEAVHKVLEGQLYYSSTITLILKNGLEFAYKIDELDIRLLCEIRNASNYREIQEILPLSKSSIERRKRNLKTLLELDIAASDRDLILSAIGKNLI